MKRIFIIPFLLMLLFSCKKKEVESLDFSVKVVKNIYKVGDTIKFLLESNADNVIFYSGLDGNKFKYKNRNVVETNNITLEFTTNRRKKLVNLLHDSFKLAVSQKFDGKFNQENIYGDKANWIDITSAFSISDSVNNQDYYVSSGVINLLNLSNLGFTLDKNKPIYFAFQSVLPFGGEHMRVNKFDIKTVSTDGQSFPIGNICNSGWNSVVFGLLPEVRLDVCNDGVLRFFSGGQVWAVSNAINLTAVKPDVGYPLENINLKSKEFKFIFKKSGNYTVTFEASKVNSYKDGKVVRQLDITIIP